MSGATCNLRLYNTLVGLGLHVVAVYDGRNKETISHLLVSADSAFAEARKRSEESACGTVDAPMQGPFIGQVVTAAEADQLNVVDFPAKI